MRRRIGDVARHLSLHGLSLHSEAAAADLGRAGLAPLDLGEERGDLVAIERLALEQHLREVVELRPMLMEHVEGDVVCLVDQLADKKITVELSEQGRTWLAEHGFDRTMGARPMARLIQNEIKKPLAEKILFGELRNGGRVRVGVREGELHLDIVPAPAPPVPPAPVSVA